MTTCTRITLSACLLVSVALLLAACASTNPLDLGYGVPRPNYGDSALPNPGPDAAPAPHVTVINPDPTKEMPPTIVEANIAGTWTFTTPPTTTCVERKNVDFHQFSLYMGRPAGTDKPFVVITVSPDARSQALADPDTYKVKNTRTYVLNGNIAKECSGTTKSGDGFCELIISKPGAAGGDVCHAVAISKDDQTQKLGLEILSSITWKATQPATPY